MKKPIGIRREDKNEWERRTPLTPEEVRFLRERHGIPCMVQPSPIRVFSDEAYRAAGAEVREDLSPCPVILGVKEMPASFFERGKTYLFFSHTIKGQPYNMAMLSRLRELGCTLIDYEKIEDDKDRRLVFFGRYAGLAGMIDGLWTLGKRLDADGLKTSLAGLKQAKDYASLEEANEAVSEVGRAFANGGLPGEITPLVVGFAGYGHVSQGAQEILDGIPHRRVEPGELAASFEKGVGDGPSVWKVVFREEHMVRPSEAGRPFILQEYYDHPERYEGVFRQYLPFLSLLVNSIFWTKAYPRLITKADARALYAGGKARLKAIADITCDPGGSVECTTHCTDPGNPVFVYDTLADQPVEAATGNGPSILAVDNLPAELPKESSEYFARTLLEFLPALAEADYHLPLEELTAPEPIKRALILKEGRFTPPFRYMRTFLDR